MASRHREQRIIDAVACPKCGSPRGDPCGYKYPNRPVIHGERRAAWPALRDKPDDA